MVTKGKVCPPAAPQIKPSGAQGLSAPWHSGLSLPVSGIRGSSKAGVKKAGLDLLLLAGSPTALTCTYAP